MRTIRVGLSPELSKVIPGFVPAVVSFEPLHMTIWLIDEKIPGGKLVTGDLKPRFVASTDDAISSLIQVLSQYPSVENSLSISELEILRTKAQ